MARPRTVTDDEVFAAAHRAMSRLGPGELRLVDIAEEAGVTASALVQRFGSKRALLLAVSSAWAGSAREMFARLRERHGSPVAVLLAYVRGMAGLAATPEALARNLAYLHVDLTDEDFRGTMTTHARATLAELATCAEDAVRAGELRPATPADTLAQVIETTIAGSMTTYAYYREGDAEAWMIERLEAVLAPYRIPCPGDER